MQRQWINGAPSRLIRGFPSWVIWGKEAVTEKRNCWNPLSCQNAEPTAQTYDSFAMTYGYARVSSRDQNLDRQLDALLVFGVDSSGVFTDKASGRDFERPGYQALLGRLRLGDALVVKSIDCLGRAYDEILEEWVRIIKRMDVAVVVLDMPLLDTRTTSDGITGVFIADVVLQLLSYVAQVERESIKQRQREGIEAARTRGVSFGRPKKRGPSCYIETRDAYLQDLLTKQKAAERLRVCASTFGKWLTEDGLQCN